MGEDRSGTSHRAVTVAEAAELLGVSVEAVRGRIKRGTLEAEREGDHVRVLLEADQFRPAGDQSTDQAQPDALISAKDETIALLREQLEAERRANEENRRIIAALTSRIPAIEAPQEPSETPSEATEQPGRVGPQTEVEGAQEPRESSGMHMPEAGGGPVPPDQQTPSERPWWRRMFGA